MKKSNCTCPSDYGIGFKQIDREKTIFHYFELCARIESEGSPAKIKDDFLVVLSIIPVFVRNKNKSRFGK